MKILDLLRIAGYITLFQISLISLFLLLKKGGNKLNRILIISLLVIWSIFITGSYILLARKVSVYVRDIGHILNLSVFLIAPILFVHFKSLFIAQYKFTAREFYHSIPFIFLSGFMIYQIVINRIINYVFYPTAIYLIVLLFIQNIIYFSLILKELNKIDNNNINQSKLKIYKFLLYSALILFILKLIIFVVWNILNYVAVCIFITGILFSIVFIIINSLILFSLENPDLLTGAFKYQNSSLAENELSTLMKNITDYFKEEKNFVDPLISLERLAKNLKMSDKLLSQVINQATNYNFNDFINGYRIKYVQKLMEEDQSKKILELAYDAGFNSKTTFNTAFKKFTNLTPREYKKNLNSNTLQ
jgi:AraC-like DNA-binding protein